MTDPSSACAILTLLNRQGLHARAAAAFVRALGSLRAQVAVTWEGRTVNGRSVLDLMTLGAPHGSELEVQVSGEDAEAALSALTTVVANRFYEE
jgi:phosphocarrier protein HPr